MIIQYTIQQTAQSVINNHLSLMFLHQRPGRYSYVWKSLQSCEDYTGHSGSDTLQTLGVNFARDTEGNIFLLFNLQSQTHTQ